jgi:uncharacterized repeat protein (TIGR01451 family)
MNKLSASLVGVIAALLQPGCSTALADHSPMRPPANSVEADGRKVIAAYGQLPLSFEANKGQSDPGVDFQARGPGYAVFLRPTEAVLVVPGRRAGSEHEGRQVVVTMQLVGASRSPARRGLDPLPGAVNYFRGNQRSEWTTNVSRYARVRYDAIYPGIDVVYYGNAGRLEHDFIVGAGADPGAIALRFDGAESIDIDDRGDLVLRIAGGQMRLPKPHIYQRRTSSVAGGYVRKGERDIAFEVGSYDRSEPLIIDPVLEYSTHLGGGTLDDFFNRSAIAADASGSAYITGQALAFPTTPGSYQPISRGSDEVFVAKMAPDGSRLIYATFIGGSSYDLGTGIAVDAAGAAYVTGNSFSADFPTTSGAPAAGGDGGRAFVAKLSADGAALVYSTRLGGSGSEHGSAIAVDSGGNAYVTGERLAGGAFVTKLNATGTAIVYSNLLGADRGRGIAVDASGNAYVTGDAAGVQATAGALQPNPGGGGDAFLIKLNPGGSIVYATNLGGSGNDYGAAIAIDPDGNAYVTGATASGDFPVTAGAFQTSLEGLYSNAAFVSKVNPMGSALLYSTLLASFDPAINTSHAAGSGIAVDGSRHVYVVGTGNVPPVDAFQTARFGSSEAFVAKLNPAAFGAGGLLFATQFGGNGTDQGHAIAVDAAGNAYLSGRTRSQNFPTVDAMQSTLGGGFVAKIAPTVRFADLVLSQTMAPDPVTRGDQVTYTVKVTNAGPDEAGAVDVIDTPPMGTYGAGVSFSASQGSCTRDLETSAGNITCALGPLAAGAEATVTIAPGLSFYSTFTNRTAIRSNVSDPHSADNSAVTSTTPVGPPIAWFFYECAGFACSFDASGSIDSTTIASYVWDFGDGATAAGPAASHTYGVAGSYTVTLTVTDNDAFTDTHSQTLAVPVVNENAPYADFGFACEGGTCSFDASNSWDPDGAIIAYDWDFGDGTTASDVSVSHTFLPGAYTVTLTVTDDQGLIGAVQQALEIAGNAPPIATFAFTCAGLTCGFNGSGSSDADGTIASYSWTFGDGQSGSGPALSHAYATYGSRTVTLTVVDTDGASGVQSQVVTLTNSTPVAAFTSTCHSLACSFDAAASSDADGTIASYSWTFGDGQSGGGSAPDHAYGAGGSYTVTLTVTDDGGAANAFSAIVMISVPTVHVGDLDGAATGQQNTWSASVIVTVHDGAHAPPATVTVNGVWSTGAASSCTTSGSGRCTFAVTAIPKRVASLTFTVTRLTYLSSTYMSGHNHDPDGDSGGTSIRVSKP